MKNLIKKIDFMEKKKIYVKNDPNVIVEDTDKISIILVDKNSFAKTQICNKVDITDEILDFLIKSGFVEQLDEPMDWFYYANHLADRMGVNVEDLCTNLSYLSNYHPMAFINVILREIALVMDHKYEGNIKDCQYVYIISSFTGAIRKVQTSDIKSFKGFAAFRSIEDATKAVIILKDFFNKVFNE